MFNPQSVFADIGKTQLNALLHLSSLSLRGATCLIGLQTEIAKGMWADSAKRWQTVIAGTGREAPKLAEWPVYLYKSSVEEGLDIARTCMEAQTRAQSELSQPINDQAGIFTNGHAGTPPGASDETAAGARSTKRD